MSFPRCNAIRQATEICRVDIAARYDHKHQSLSETDATSGLSRMSIDITKVLIRKLATQGHCFNQSTFRTIKATYFRIALDMINFYQSDAELNGLAYDINVEEKAVELFAENIMRAGDDFTYSPMETPFIPSGGGSSLPSPDLPPRCAELSRLTITRLSRGAGPRRLFRSPASDRDDYPDLSVIAAAIVSVSPAGGLRSAFRPS